MKRTYQFIFRVFRKELSRLFNLKDDMADHEFIDKSLRTGIEMKGSKLWILIFAIFIASIGLNINSTAVIIGAMLISPILDPILGIGYGVGVYDINLVKAALKNLSIAILISLLASTIYFLISPLKEAHSELLARTTPTIWDVLIATFGGLAGIISITRKEKTHVIAGAAIATALMPPLCTAGFGLAHGHWAFFGEAFYLLTINCVFIALSSAFVIRVFHIEQKHFVSYETSRSVKIISGVVALLTVIPSLYLAYVLVQEEIFKSNAQYFITHDLALQHTYVTQSNVDPKSKTIEITVIGEFLSSKDLAAIAGRLPSVGLADAKLEVHQGSAQQIDVSTLKSDFLEGLSNKNQQSFKEKEQK